MVNSLPLGLHVSWLRTEQPILVQYSTVAKYSRGQRVPHVKSFSGARPRSAPNMHKYKQITRDTLHPYSPVLVSGPQTHQCLITHAFFQGHRVGVWTRWMKWKNTEPNSPKSKKAIPEFCGYQTNEKHVMDTLVKSKITIFVYLIHG